MKYDSYNTIKQKRNTQLNRSFRPAAAMSIGLRSLDRVRLIIAVSAAIMIVSTAASAAQESPVGDRLFAGGYSHSKAGHPDRLKSGNVKTHLPAVNDRIAIQDRQEIERIHRRVPCHPERSKCRR